MLASDPTLVEGPAEAAEAPTVLGARPAPPAVRLVGATTHELPPGTTTIGRGAAADLRVDDRKASRLHATVDVTVDGVVIEDRGSVNGTRVNGGELTGPRRLEPGDRIAIGEMEWTVEIS